jgi:hypothetical protein
LEVLLDDDECCTCVTFWCKYIDGCTEAEVKGKSRTLAQWIIKKFGDCENELLSRD